MNEIEAKRILRNNKVDICMDPRNPIEILESMQSGGTLQLLENYVEVQPVTTPEE